MGALGDEDVDAGSHRGDRPEGPPRRFPLRDELDLISKYLSVEKVRLGDKLKIRTR